MRKAVERDLSTATWAMNSFTKFAAGVSLLVSALCFVPARVASQAGQYVPEVRRTDEGIPYVSTGVGYDSRVNLPRFSVTLIFATRTGAYLANIHAEITSVPAGKTVRIDSPGPWLLLDLAPGSYRVQARTEKGQLAHKSFRVPPGRTTRVRVSWNISDEDI